MEEIFSLSKWIWAENNTKAGDWVLLRRKFSLLKPPKTAIARIAAESKYSMYVNGKRVVMDGGLPRESVPGCGYYDEIDLARYLVKGDNAFGFLVRHYGNDGKNSVMAGAAGFLFECPEADVYSNDKFRCLRLDAYVQAEDEGEPFSNLYAGTDVCYDATRENPLVNVFMPEFESNLLSAATELGAYGDAPFRELVKRPLPQFDFTNVLSGKKFKKTVVDSVTVRYEYDLGGAKSVFPYLEVFAYGAEKITVCTDRYLTQGADGDEKSFYRNNKLVYICKNGPQEFESEELLSGTRLVVTMPASVKLLSIGCRETSYPSAVTGSFTVKNDDVNAFMQKAQDTLSACMRDTFYDCPDRERTLWLGDLSLTTRAAAYTHDENALRLVKKCLDDVKNFALDNVLLSNVTGNCPVEIPSHGLLFLSEYGAVATYFDFTGDKTALSNFFDLGVSYLAKWDMGEDGFVQPRDGHKRWFDYGYNADEKVLENCLYFSALRFMQKVADVFSLSQYNEFLTERSESIRDNFEKAFWSGEGYCSNGYLDERANAWAVLSGLAAPIYYEKLAKLLSSVFTGSPYAEFYVLEALAKMNRKDVLLQRFSARYCNMISSDNPTLPENFNGIGTLCHGYTAAPAALFYRYFAGVNVLDGIKAEITPSAVFDELKFCVRLFDGKISGQYRKYGESTEIVLENSSSLECFILLSKEALGAAAPDKVVRLSKGKQKITC